MAAGYALGLPGNLDRMACALGLAQRKDADGYRVMMQLCKPSPNGAFCTPGTHPELHQKLREYCKQDVVVEREICRRLPALHPDERRAWILDQQINDRGISVDSLSVEVSRQVVTAEEQRLNDRMGYLTKGRVERCGQNVALVKWLHSKNCHLDSVAADVITEALERPGLLPEISEVFEVRREFAKASCKKLETLARGVSTRDGRVKGLLQFHGAATGRWTGRRFQPQNLPRPSLDHGTIDWLLESPEDRLTPEVLGLFGPPMTVLSDCIRSFLVAAPGKQFFISDLSQIEARVLPWLAGDSTTLDAFHRGESVYEHAAAGIYHVRPEEIGKHDVRRQIGKVATIALGYGGGKRAFVTMGRNYGVRVPESEAESIKLAWRASHPEIVLFWKEIEAAAVGAVVHPGNWQQAGKHLAWRVSGSFLLCRLPSGRNMVYPYPALEKCPCPWDPKQLKETLTYQTVNESDNEWVRARTYGGKLAENATQAVARDALRDGMLRLDAHGFGIVLHVHDEVVVETDSATTLDTINDLMVAPLEWAPDLPLEADGWTGWRYRK